MSSCYGWYSIWWWNDTRRCTQRKQGWRTSEEQTEITDVEIEERQEKQNEEECSEKIEQNSNKNSVNDSEKKPKGQSNRKNGKSGSNKVSANERPRKKQHNIGQSNIKNFTTPASKLIPTSQHTPPTPPSREDNKKLYLDLVNLHFNNIYI